MEDNEPGPLRPEADCVDAPALAPDAGGGDTEGDTAADAFGALRDDLTALVNDAHTYAEAEIAFQKARAGLAGKAAARALVLLVLALVMLHLALIALAVGLVIALVPLLTIWGAIATVVGVLLAGVAALVFGAVSDGKTLAALFGSGDKP